MHSPQTAPGTQRATHRRELHRTSARPGHRLRRNASFTKRERIGPDRSHQKSTAARSANGKKESSPSRRISANHDASRTGSRPRLRSRSLENGGPSLSRREASSSHIQQGPPRGSYAPGARPRADRCTGLSYLGTSHPHQHSLDTEALGGPSIFRARCTERGGVCPSSPRKRPPAHHITLHTDKPPGEQSRTPGHGQECSTLAPQEPLRERRRHGSRRTVRCGGCAMSASNP